MVDIEAFLELVFSQRGKPYKFGAETDPNDPSPPAFDCSEIFEWASRRLGVEPALVDGSWRQVRQLQDLGLLLPVSQAIATRGALLFKFSESPFTDVRPKQAHVAISLG